MEIRADVRIYSGIFLVILAALAVIIFFIAAGKHQKSITDFEQCAAAGYPVTQSYPPQCTLPNGRFFVRQLMPER
jgi:hypothetical protein